MRLFSVHIVKWGLASSAAFWLCGCQTTITDKPSAVAPVEIGVSVSTGYDNQNDDLGMVAIDTTYANTVSFVVDGGVVTSLSTHQYLSPELRLALDATRDLDLYVVSNAKKCVALNEIQPGSAVEKLMSVAVSDIEHLSPSEIPMSGVARFKAGQSKFVLLVKRVCSRVDLKLDNVLIYSLKVEGVAASSPLFVDGSAPAGVQSVTFSRSFDTVLSRNLTAALYLFEQSTTGLVFTLDCSIVGGVNRQKVVVHIPYNKIIRNNIYRLVVSDKNLDGEVVEARFELLPWIGQDVDAGYPDLSVPVEVDASKFEFDANNVLFDAARRTLHVSFRGDTLRIPFTGNFDKRFSVKDADSRVEVVRVASSRYAYDAIELRLTQPVGGGAYSFVFNVKNALSTNSLGADYLVTVDQNSPASVVMGGVEWMAFNCGSGREFPTLDIKQSVRDIYRASWGDYVNMSQWGMRAKALPNRFLPPSISMRYVEPTYSDGALANPSLWVDKTPCPDGWRLPKIAEVRKFFPPNGTAIAGGNVVRYAVDGVNYTAQVVAAGGANYVTQNATSPGSERVSSYVPKILVISDGQGEIIFPLSGYRRQDSVQNGDGDYCDIAYKIGTAFFIWCDAQNGSRGDSAQAAGINRYGNISVDSFDFGNILKGSWNTVRCVRSL